jgi:uncharacterized phage-like protein YoqJ
MKVLVSGHRIQKLAGYDHDWIKGQLRDAVQEHWIGLIGMASGVDLWFCEALLSCGAGFQCYIPFEGQEKTMNTTDALCRYELVKKAWGIKKTRNSQMVEDCDMGLIVWDGNKGGTHNVFQQMIECGKPFLWIDPANERTYKINEW